MAEEKGQGPPGPVAPPDLSENQPGTPAGNTPAAGGPPDGEEGGTLVDLVEDAEADEFEQPSAPPVLDEAHVGDIKGALGTIRLDDVAPQGSWRGRLVVLLAVMGPGLIVMVGDNDAGGVSTYAQAGQNYGTSLLWVLVLLIPVLIVNQEMVVRLGAVTGVGHATADPRALRPLLGVLLGDRPLRPQLPDDRDRVHRHRPRPHLLRAQQVPDRADRRRRC